jgi:hypothetical protein
MKQATIHNDNHGIYHPFMLHENEIRIIVSALELLNNPDQKRLESLYGRIEPLHGKLSFPLK